MGRKRKILVVDDGAFVRFLTRRLLDHSCYCTEEAANGHEALALLAREKYDLLITDWCMPGMNGTDLCRQVRADFPQVSVVIMSALKLNREDVTRLGAVDYFEKSFDCKVFCLAIARILSEQPSLDGQDD